MHINGLLDMELYYFLNCFFIYSFIGWVFECVVMSFETRSPVINRGFISGPLCTIYGVASMAMYIILKPVSDNMLLLYIGGLVLTTLIEIVTAKIMISLFGSFWWDYTNKPFNYKGIICLESSLFWGLSAIIIFKIVHPRVTGLVDLYYLSWGKAVVLVILFAYIIDFSYNFYRAFSMRDNALSEDELVGIEMNEN